MPAWHDEGESKEPPPKWRFWRRMDKIQGYTNTDNPRFFLTKREVKKAFNSEYVFGVQPWEDMGDDEIQKWYDLVHNEMSEFPVYSYDEDKQQWGKGSDTD